MSSVQSFLKQRVPSATFFQAPAGTYYQLLAASGNIVGNYPPGYMVAVDAPVNAGRLIRDMGKTIKAKVGADPNGTAREGFFRAVQVVNPSNSDLVLGVPAAAGDAGNKGYQTYYLATIVDGGLATDASGVAAVLPATYVPNGGSM
jgi:hypothetical protein